MSTAEITAIAEKSPIWTGSFRGKDNENSEMMLPCTDRLAGRQFGLRFDAPGSATGGAILTGDIDRVMGIGRTWNYEILDGHRLRFEYDGFAGKGDDDGWREERYEAFESDSNLFFLVHTVTGKFPMETMNIVLDFDTGLVTCLHNSMDNPAHPREPVQDWLFGIIEADGGAILSPKYRRHGFTTELVGRSYTWSYTKTMTSQHIYSSPVSYSWSIMLPDGSPGLMWSSPCRYVKIREGIYFMSWVEERSAGNQNAILFNTKTMHDVGACLGINHEQVFEFNTFGAESRSAGSIDLSGVYGL